MDKLDIINFAVNNMSKDPRQLDIEDYIDIKPKFMNKKDKKYKPFDEAIRARPDLKPFINKIKNEMTDKNIGHNSGEVNKSTASQLRGYIEGIENYENQKKDISESIKEIFDNAKSAGFDVKIMRKVLKLRKTDPAKLQEEQYLLETYCENLQMDLFK